MPRRAFARDRRARAREVAALYSEGLAGLFERAVLRETLQRHVIARLRSAIQWMSARLGRLTIGRRCRRRWSIAAGVPSFAAVDALTPRELDVLRLMARGKTNARSRPRSSSAREP